MPVEINELVIKASITAPDKPQKAAAPLNDDQQKVQQLLDDVLKKLNEKGER